MRENSFFLIFFSPFAFLFPLVLFPGLVVADVSHTVKAGESLYEISKKYHLSIEQVWAANELTDSKIQPGQKLIIPGAEGERSLKKQRLEAESEAEPASPQIPKTHKVKKGETLGSIAKKYNLPINDLKELNELRGKTVKPGQILQLRLEEDDFDFDQNGNEGAWTEKQDETRAYVQGNGFLAEEKNKELIASAAKSFLGFRYTKGGSGVNGMDCSSYVQRVYKIFGIDLPRTAREQFQMGYAVAQNALKAGDLVFFKRAKARQPTHVGIYIGNDQFIHTSLKKKQVDIGSTDSGYFKKWFLGAKRIEEVEAKIESKSSAGE